MSYCLLRDMGHPDAYSANLVSNQIMILSLKIHAARYEQQGPFYEAIQRVKLSHAQKYARKYSQ